MTTLETAAALDCAYEFGNGDYDAVFVQVFFLVGKTKKDGV